MGRSVSRWTGQLERAGRPSPGPPRGRNGHAHARARAFKQTAPIALCAAAATPVPSDPVGLGSGGSADQVGWGYEQEAPYLGPLTGGPRFCGARYAATRGHACV